MPMPRREDGRRAIWSARLSEPEARAAGDICAKLGLKHSEWLQGLVRSAIANGNGHDETKELRILVAGLEAELEQARNSGRAAECRRCGEPLACPQCQGGGEYA